MSAIHRHGVISSFFLFAAVFVFATSASATEIPFEDLPYGTPLHSKKPADGAASSVAPSNGSAAHDLTVQRPGAPAGEVVVLAAYRTRAVRDPQPRSGVPTRSGSFGPQPFQVAGSASGLPFSRPGGSGSSSSGDDMGLMGFGVASAIAVPIPIGPDNRGSSGPEIAPDGEDTGRHWGDPGDMPGSRDFGSSSAPLPEPSAALVFGLGALLVKSATRRSRR